MNTFSWDTVYAVNLNRLNEQLQNNRKSAIQDINIIQQEPIPVAVTGHFKPWRIVPSGSGEFLHIAIPFEEGQMLLETGKTVRIDLRDTVVTIEIALRLIPSLVDPKQQELQFHIERVGKSDQPSELGMIRPIAIDSPYKQFTKIQEGLLMNAMCINLVNNASKITYAFAKINLVEPGSGSWLDPVRAGYSFIGLKDTHEGYLAVLSTTSNRDISQLERKATIPQLPPDANAYFAISERLFFEHIMMPAFSVALGSQVHTENFHFDPELPGLRNHSTLTLPSIREGLIDYVPHVDTFHAILSTNQLNIQINGNIDMGIGIVMSFDITFRNRARFDDTKKLLLFDPDPQPVVHHKADIPWYLYPIALIPAGLAAGIANLIANDIIVILEHITESLTLTNQAPITLTWAGMKPFDIKAAGLEQSLLMSGIV